MVVELKQSHGHAVALTLEKFLKFNFLNCEKANCSFDLKKRYKNIFDIFSIKNIFELEHSLIKIRQEANLKNDFKKLKIDIHDGIDKIIDGINLMRLKNNPINLNKQDIKTILLKHN